MKHWEWSARHHEGQASRPGIIPQAIKRCLLGSYTPEMKSSRGIRSIEHVMLVAYYSENSSHFWDIKTLFKRERRKQKDGER